MATSVANLEINGAEFNNMCGLIDVPVLPDRERYLFRFSSGGCLTCRRWDRVANAFSGASDITHDSALQLLGTRHWTWANFVSVWSGWAAGYKQGRLEGRREVFEENDTLGEDQ